MLTHEQYIRIRYLYTVDHLTSVQIGGILNISERTVRNWWKVTEYPQKQHNKRERTPNHEDNIGSNGYFGLDLGTRHRYLPLPRQYGVADTGQHISNRIINTHDLPPPTRMP